MIGLVLLILGLVGLGVFSAILMRETGEDLWIIAAMVSVIGLLVILIALPVEYMDSKAQVRQFIAVRDTVDMARTRRGGDIETAAMAMKIAEMNQWLAKAQYYESRQVWGPFWTPEVRDLKPIH